MEKIKLTREKLVDVLKNEFCYSDSSIKFLLASRTKPNYDIMLKLSKEHGVPFEAWQDIRAWLGLPPTKTQLKQRGLNE